MQRSAFIGQSSDLRSLRSPGTGVPIADPGAMGHAGATDLLSILLKEKGADARGRVEV